MAVKVDRSLPEGTIVHLGGVPVTLAHVADVKVDELNAEKIDLKLAGLGAKQADQVIANMTKAQNNEVLDAIRQLGATVADVAKSTVKIGAEVSVIGARVSKLEESDPKSTTAEAKPKK